MLVWHVTDDESDRDWWASVRTPADVRERRAHTGPGSAGQMPMFPSSLFAQGGKFWGAKGVLRPDHSKRNRWVAALAKIKIFEFTEYVFDKYISPDAHLSPYIRTQFPKWKQMVFTLTKWFFNTAHPNTYLLLDILLGFQTEVCIDTMQGSHNLKEDKEDSWEGSLNQAADDQVIKRRHNTVWFCKKN